MPGLPAEHILWCVHPHTHTHRHTQARTSPYIRSPWYDSKIKHNQSQTDTHSMPLCLHTLIAFTLTDKQRTWTPTRRRESTQSLLAFSKKTVLCKTLLTVFSELLQSLQRSASNALPTFIISRTVAPKVNACMYKASHIGDTTAQQVWVYTYSCQNKSKTKKQGKSVCVCVCPLAWKIRPCQELSGVVRSWETILDHLTIYSGHGSNPTSALHAWAAWRNP